MSKKVFTEKEIKLLSSNQYVKSVSSKVLHIRINLSVYLLGKRERQASKRNL